MLLRRSTNPKPLSSNVATPLDLNCPLDKSHEDNILCGEYISRSVGRSINRISSLKDSLPLPFFLGFVKIKRGRDCLCYKSMPLRCGASVDVPT